MKPFERGVGVWALASLMALGFAQSDSPSFTETFNGPVYRYLERTEDFGSTAYADGGFRLRLTKPGIWFQNMKVGSPDVKLEVEVRQTNALQNGSAGLVCRNDGQHLYAFLLFPESFSATISRYDYETEEWVFLAGGDLPQDVNLAPSGQPNRIGAECDGRRLTCL